MVKELKLMQRNIRVLFVSIFVILLATLKVSAQNNVSKEEYQKYEL